MTAYICTTCGAQFAPSAEPPDICPVCSDERQYVNWEGQQWTTLAELRAHHTNRCAWEGEGILGIGTEPQFAIGQRALLLRTPAGNVLWDCVSLIDDRTCARVRELGGISAIAISHPHYYSSMVEWSQAFGAPIYLHDADRRWVMRHDPAIRFWDGATREIAPGVTLIRMGGHFAGGAVLYWNGSLFSGDIIQVAMDRRWVSFLYSYPNMIPLPVTAVRRMVDAVEPYPYERIYGAWWGRIVGSGAKEAVQRSADRYERALTVEMSLETRAAG